MSVLSSRFENFSAPGPYAAVITGNAVWAKVLQPIPAFSARMAHAVTASGSYPPYSCSMVRRVSGGGELPGVPEPGDVGGSEQGRIFRISFKLQVEVAGNQFFDRFPVKIVFLFLVGSRREKA